jgi:hypothetical protein
MPTTISHPPTNSLSTYSCGIVGQLEYSLIPKQKAPSSLAEVPFLSFFLFSFLSSHSQPQKRSNNPPCRISSLSRTLYAAHLLGSTPCRPKICTVARENPQAGMSGVPFIKMTTGAEEMALSISDRVWSERSRRPSVAHGGRGREDVDVDGLARQFPRAVGVARWKSCCVLMAC